MQKRYSINPYFQNQQKIMPNILTDKFNMALLDVGVLFAIINFCLLLKYKKINKEKSANILVIWIICTVLNILEKMILEVGVGITIDYQPTIEDMLTRLLMALIPLITQLIMFIYIMVTLIKNKKEGK